MRDVLIRVRILALIVIACSALPGAIPAEQSIRDSLGILDASGPVIFFVEDGKGVPGYKATDRELARMALDAWSRESGGKLKFVEAKTEDQAVLRLRWISSADGLFGEMQRIRVGGKNGAVVRVMPEVQQLGERLSIRAMNDALLRDTIVYLTCVHEFGHAVGLSHTNNFQDIMYYFGYGGDIVDYFQRYRARLKVRADIARHSGLSPNDIQFLTTLYPE